MRGKALQNPHNFQELKWTLDKQSEAFSIGSLGAISHVKLWYTNLLTKGNLGHFIATSEDDYSGAKQTL